MGTLKARLAQGLLRRQLLIWVGFLLLAGLAVIAISLYASYAKKQLDADYIAFSGEIVRAQHDGDALRQASLNLLVDPQPLHQRQLLQSLWIIDSRQSTTMQYLKRNNLATTDLSYIMDEFARLDALLEQTQPLAETVLERPGQLERLDRLTSDIEHSMAFIYSELHGLMIRGATEQQHIMSVMTQIIVALGALVLVVILGLLIAIDKILGQQSALKQLSVTDELTVAKRSGAPVSLAILDIDHFKHINDRYGHPFGDQVLQQLSRTLTKLVRESDVVHASAARNFAY